MLLWPVASVTFSQWGAAPKIGSVSGVLGRNPAHILSMALCSSTGVSFIAVLSSHAIPPAVTWASKPTSSLVAPTMMVPSVLGARYTASPKMIWRRGAEGGAGCLKERICPGGGLMGSDLASQSPQRAAQAPDATTRWSQAIV